MVVGIIVLIISIAMAVRIYQVVDKHGGKQPWLWAAGAFVFWPLAAIIAGYKYNETAMQLVGVVGLGLTVLGVASVGVW
jgi:hypothetical protein